MANVKKRLTSNVPGNFFVDSTCIDCDACRQLAPGTFAQAGEYSTVGRQPDGEAELLQAYQALVACPVGSIGTEHSDKRLLEDAVASFPLHVDGGVYSCGFNSEKSFGANSYFVARADGNWLVDSPRFLPRLVDWFERRGGIRYIFLTHEDDVADSDRYAARFGATRIIHRADAHAAPGTEWIVDGGSPVPVGERVLMIPVPGHTAGSMALCVDDRFLFTGDHLWWDRDERTLGAPERLVWNHQCLVESVAKLLDHRFEWVLPGHGDRIHLPPVELRSHLENLAFRRGGILRQT